MDIIEILLIFFVFMAVAMFFAHFSACYGADAEEMEEEVKKNKRVLAEARRTLKEDKNFTGDISF